MDRDVVLSVTKRSLRRSDSPHLRIRFHLSFVTKYYSNRDSQTGSKPTAALPYSDTETSYADVVDGKLSYATVEGAVGDAFRDRLRGRECSRAIMLAWRQVPKIFTRRAEAGRYFLLHVDMKIRIRIWNDVPAAASSLRLLEKCNDEEEDLGCCCICVGEVDEALRMPCCSRAFHAECIEEWLRKSHYCPVCQFEMPTDENEEIKSTTLKFMEVLRF
ncbi:hypothetical protein AAHA92_27563 [Salvia divinorum]|uniref:RING-type E3 ubiquitin transferase n=1 Tax=Salvia divinorum TaxID=28513 RepID=A0ABD1G719_SALDI